jgi:hypothetical protein
MGPKRSPRDEGDGATVPFDVTQEIDPALADELRQGGEQTLTQTDFDEITLVLPEKRKPRP